MSSVSTRTACAIGSEADVIFLWEKLFNKPTKIDQTPSINDQYQELPPGEVSSLFNQSFLFNCIRIVDVYHQRFATARMLWNCVRYLGGKNDLQS